MECAAYYPNIGRGGGRPVASGAVDDHKASIRLAIERGSAGVGRSACTRACVPVSRRAIESTPLDCIHAAIQLYIELSSADYYYCHHLH